MPRRIRPVLDRRVTFTQEFPEGDAAADAGWFGEPAGESFQRWAAVRDFSGAERLAAGVDVSALQSRFVVRADGETEAIRPRSHSVDDERGKWDVVSVSRSPLRSRYLELTVVLRQ